MFLLHYRGTRPFGPLLLPPLVLALCGAAPAWAQGDPPESPDAASWNVSLGGGAMVRPYYLGAKRYKIAPLPFFDVEWNRRVFLSPEGLGAYAINTPDLKLGLAAGVAGGRNLSHEDAFKGIGNVPTGAMVRLFGSYRFDAFTFNAELERRIGAVSGTLAELGVSYGGRLGPRFFYSFGPKLTFADSGYNEGFFGVSEQQSADAAAAGRSVPVYHAGAGLRDVAFDLNAGYQLTQHWGLGGRVSVLQLTGDAADSPFTRSSVQPSAGVFLRYRF